MDFSCHRIDSSSMFAPRLAGLSAKTLEDRFLIPIIGAEDALEHGVTELAIDF